MMFPCGGPPYPFEGSWGGEGFGEEHGRMGRQGDGGWICKYDASKIKKIKKKNFQGRKRQQYENTGWAEKQTKTIYSN